MPDEIDALNKIEEEFILKREKRLKEIMINEEGTIEIKEL